MIAPVALSAIRADIQAQPRDTINTDIVQEYAKAMMWGAEFPPLVVFYDGERYWLADGFHRYYAGLGCASEDSARAAFPCDVRQGGLREAVLYSVGANEHGYRRTDADRRRAIMKLVCDEEWSSWSATEIAKRCRVSPHTVKRVRDDIAAYSEGQPKSEDGKYRPGRAVVYDNVPGKLPLTLHAHSDEGHRTYKTKHGTIAQMNTAAIGRRDRAEPAATEEPWTPADIETASREAGQSAPAPAASQPPVPDPWFTEGNLTIFNDLYEIDRMIGRMPEPAETVGQVARRVRHSFSSARFQEISDWFAGLAAEWRSLEVPDVAAE